MTSYAAAKRTFRIVVLAVGAFLLSIDATQASDGGRHAPIVILSDHDFAACTCVASGDGSVSDPYVIGPLSINNASGLAVYVDGTNLSKSFVLRDLTIAGNRASTSTGIVLNHINPGGSQGILAEVAGGQTSIQTNNLGILVDHSSYVTLGGGGGASASGPGVANRGAGTINKNASGAIDIEDSSHVTVRGWQLSANGGDFQPDWVTLDPSVRKWGVGGVRLFGVTDSTLDHNAANNDTDVSYSLFASSHNTLSNNTADYPFTMNYLITDGSSYNTLGGNEGSTGDFIGLMVADPLPGSWTLATYGPSHDNAIVGNTIHTDGPIGNELSPVDIVPSFIGGIVVLNGTLTT
jgi:parallel beta-helix repeat protein